MAQTRAYKEAQNLINELDKLRIFTNCSSEELHNYRDRVYEIATFSGRTTYEILSEVNHLLSNSQRIIDIKSVIDYVDNRYRGKRNNEWQVKFLGTWTNKEDDSYMNNRKLDVSDAIYNSSMFYFDLLKDRNGLVKNKFDKDTIKDVIFNDPATIVIWKDGTKTVVKCQKETGDTYNKELGLAMCIIKKCCGNKGNYNDVFNKWIK